MSQSSIVHQSETTIIGQDLHRQNHLLTVSANSNPIFNPTGQIDTTDSMNPIFSRIFRQSSPASEPAQISSSNSSSSFLQKIFHNNSLPSDSTQGTQKSSQTKPTDVTTALILWLIALLGNFIGLLATILDGSFQAQIHQSMPMQIPPGLNPAEIKKMYTTACYIVLIFMTVMTALLIWKYSQGVKACYLLLTAGGFLTILQGVGVFFAETSAYKAIAAIIAAIAVIGAILCSRTNDSMQYFGFKQGNNGKY